MSFHDPLEGTEINSNIEYSYIEYRREEIPLSSLPTPNSALVPLSP
jgi:hypothetical protein